jgi:hypothetical protein
LTRKSRHRELACTVKKGKSRLALDVYAIFSFLPGTELVLSLQSFIYFRFYNSLHSSVNLAATIGAQVAIFARNMVEEEKKVKDKGGRQAQRRNDPDDEGPQHAKEDNGLFTIL